MLDAADLEVNVLEFRQRSFQFERLAPVDGEEVALFSRTETESESQFRPRLVHLKLLVPLSWIVLDEPHEVLAIARDGATVPVRLSEPVVEVGAERAEFSEQGIAWRRVAGPSGSLVYAPRELADRLLAPAAFGAFGIA
ncbi:MAG TPA: hypothetical protein VEL82_07250 [Thermoplasmata archaeon]|nr:hypothetical protein [Thermoplasmata archaeon]